MTRHSSRRHSSRRHSHRASVPAPTIIPGEPVVPYSETRVQPDAQWVPIVAIQSPLKVVQTPLYISSLTPAPQWAPNVNIGQRRGFLKTQFRDNIRRHVYGTNPFSDTVNSGGPHFQ